jgi:hypothetical protein
MYNHLRKFHSITFGFPLCACHYWLNVLLKSTHLCPDVHLVYFLVNSRSIEVTRLWLNMLKETIDHTLFYCKACFLLFLQLNKGNKLVKTHLALICIIKHSLIALILHDTFMNKSSLESEKSMNMMKSSHFCEKNKMSKLYVIQLSFGILRTVISNTLAMLKRFGGP